MSKVWRARILLFVGFALLFWTTSASAAVVTSQSVTVKRFTGLLSGTGVVPTPPFAFLSLPTVDYITFICDPLSLNWKIRVSHDPFTPTILLPDANGVLPYVCAHVEILMYYYNPQVAGFDGTAITIQKIP